MRCMCIYAEIVYMMLFLVTSCCSHPTSPHQNVPEEGDDSIVQLESSFISKTTDFIKPDSKQKPTFPATVAEELAVRALDSSTSSTLSSRLPISLSKFNMSTSHTSHNVNALGDPPDPAIFEEYERKLELSFYSRVQAQKSDADTFAIALMMDVVSIMGRTQSKSTDHFPFRNYRFCDRGNHPQALCFASYDMNDNMTYADMSILGDLFQRWTGKWVDEDVPGCQMLYSSIQESGLTRLAMAIFDVFGAKDA